MRTRLAALMALILIAATFLVAGSPARADDGYTSTGSVVLAQGSGDDQGGGDEAQQNGGEEEGGGAADEGTGGAAEETGPPWTYQMARIALVLTVLLGLRIALMYRKLVGGRQRH
jgi:hypothetical protein